MTVANVYFQRVLAGNRITGNAPNGVRTPTTTESPTFSGVVEAFNDCTESGLFEFSKTAPRSGVTLLSLMLQGTGITSFTLELIGTSLPNAANDKPEFMLLTGAEQEFIEQAPVLTNFVYVFKRPVIVPPGFDVRLRSQGNFTTGGSFTLTVGPGLVQSAGFTLVKSN